MKIHCPKCGAFFTEILSPLPGNGDRSDNPETTADERDEPAPYIVRFYCRRCHREQTYNLAACLSQSVRAGNLRLDEARRKDARDENQSLHHRSG